MPEKADPVSALRKALRGFEEALNCINRLSPRTITDDWRAELDVARAALSGEAPDRDGEPKPHDHEHYGTGPRVELAPGWSCLGCGQATNSFVTGSLVHPEIGLCASCVSAIRAPSLEGARHPEAGGQE